MNMSHQPMRRALVAAGAIVESIQIYTYQDYLYELCAGGTTETPVTERQWEMICDMQGRRTLYFASNTESAIKLAERNKTKV